MSANAGKVYAAEMVPVSFCDFVSEPASVIFFSGCNFDCGYCQNWRLKKQLPEHLTDISAIKDALARNKLISACKVTGGEPLLQLEPLIELGRFARSIGLKFGIDTNGSMPDLLKQVLPLLDLVSLDIKAPFDLHAYSRVTGIPSPDLDSIKASLRLAVCSGAYLDVRIVVIPGYNDDLSMLATVDSELRSAGFSAKDESGMARLTIVEFLPENAHHPLFNMTRNPSVDLLQKVASKFAFKNVMITHRALGGCLRHE